MELTIALVISILGCVISVSNFVLGRKDKAVKDTKEESSNQVLIDYRLTQLEKKLDQVLDKLNNQEVEVKKIVSEEMKKHILEFHRKED